MGVFNAVNRVTLQEGDIRAINDSSMANIIYHKWTIKEVPMSKHVFKGGVRLVAKFTR